MELPVIDLAPYLEVSSKSSGNCRDEEEEEEELELDPELKTLCCEVSRTLRETGALLVKDPRCSANDNDRFIDMMENYFERPQDFKRRQERPHLHYQGLSVGSFCGGGGQGHGFEKMKMSYIFEQHLPNQRG